MRYVKFEWLKSKNSERGRYLGENFQPSKLPDSFEFLLVQHSINIKKERDNKEKYLDLLFEADPSKEMINKYLSNGELFVLTYNEEPVCIAVTIKKDNDTIELKNIVTKIYKKCYELVRR